VALRAPHRTLTTFLTPHPCGLRFWKALPLSLDLLQEILPVE